MDSPAKLRFPASSLLIPGIASNLTSKSNTTRSYCCQFISQLLQSWPKHCIERHLSKLQDAVKRGLSDAEECNWMLNTSLLGGVGSNPTAGTNVTFLFILQERE